MKLGPPLRIRFSILKSRPRILGLVVILVLVGGVFYFFSIQERPRVSPPKLVSLTKEQKEVDNFLEEYYLAYGNASITRLIVLFDNDAILSSPSGAVYKGFYAIRSYYVEDIDSFWNFTIDKTASTIEVRGNEAYATYNIRVGPWYIGVTESVKFYYKDTFELKREGDTWKITALTIEQTSAR